MFRLGVLKANGKTYFRVGHCNKTNKTITKKKKKKKLYFVVNCIPFVLVPPFPIMYK